jgi:DNA polymerase III delta prime subunit
MEYYNDKAKFSSNIWTDLYRPKTISELVGNKKAIHEFTKWLQDYENAKITINTAPAPEQAKNGKKKTGGDIKKTKKDLPKSSAIIVGDHGTGKTITATIILKDMGYQINTLNFDQIREIMKQNNGDKMDKNIFINIIDRLAGNTNIVDMIRGASNKKVALFVDEIESISSTADKKIISKLIKLNEQKWYFPIIMVSNNNHNKLLTEITKNSHVIKFWSLFYDDMKKIFLKIAKAESLQLASEQVIKLIIDYAHGDIRQMIHILQGLTRVFPDTVIKSKMVTMWQDNFYEENIDDDLFEASGQLLRGYQGIENQLRCYETEKVLIPLMVHQNYYKMIIDSNLDKKKQLEVAEKIAESLSSGDISENYIYGNQNWDLQRIHGFEMCVYTSFYLNHYLNENRYGIQKLDFPQDLNKTSIMRINRKNIDSANYCFIHKSVDDYLCMNHLITSLLLDDRLDSAIKLFEGYGLKKENIEALMKIDKLTSNDDQILLFNNRGITDPLIIKKMIKDLANKKKEMISKILA